jgi:hypothetical protein
MLMISTSTVDSNSRDKASEVFWYESGPDVVVLLKDDKDVRMVLALMSLEITLPEVALATSPSATLGKALKRCLMVSSAHMLLKVPRSAESMTRLGEWESETVIVVCTESVLLAIVMWTGCAEALVVSFANMMVI